VDFLLCDFCEKLVNFSENGPLLGVWPTFGPLLEGKSVPLEVKKSSKIE